MSDDIRVDTGADQTGADDHAERELTLHRDAELAAEMMLDNEGARLANLSYEDRMMVSSGLAEKLRTAARDNNLDVAELRSKLALSKPLVREEGHEL